MKHIALHFQKKDVCALLLLALMLCGCASSQPLQQQPEEITEAEATQKVYLDNYELDIPEIHGKYHFLFLTDSHVAVTGELDSKTIKNYSAHRLSQFYNETGLITSQLFTDFIDLANEEEFDGLLLGGDIIDSPSSANIKFLDSSLKQLTIPYIYTLGNHDWTYPWEYMTEIGITNYLSALSPFMKESPAIHTLEYDDFTIVSVDNSNNQINPDAMEEYAQILEQGKPVILMLHVPLYTKSLLAKTQEQWTGSVILGGGVHGGFYPNDISSKFMQLTTAKDSPVVLVLAGHVHLSDKSFITGEKNILQITGDGGYKGKAAAIHINALP